MFWHLEDGFNLINEDRCYLYKEGRNENEWIKLCFHVDDNAIAARNEKFYAAYQSRLTSKFDVEEGPLDSHLGVNYHFNEDHSHLLVEQSDQVREVLAEFQMEDCNPESTPTMAGPVPCKADCEIKYEGQWDMESLVGHVLYLYMCTRCDVGHPLKRLSRFIKEFGKKHVELAKHLLRYLKGSINKGLEYTAKYPMYLQIFTDASHANCKDTGRSILSIVCKMGGNTVYWKNSFSSIVCHSSFESEGVRWLSDAMGGLLQNTVSVFVDNSAAVSTANNPLQPGRNLHVHARYFYVRDLVNNSRINVHHIPTSMQVADVGCSYKGGPNFRQLREYLLRCARVVFDDDEQPLEV